MSAAPDVAQITVRGLPVSCPHSFCGYLPPAGEWPVGVFGGRLVVVCPACHLTVAPVVAVAGTVNMPPQSATCSHPDCIDRTSPHISHGDH